MDALTGMLDGPRAKGAFLLRSVQDPPWSVRVQDRAPLSVVAVARGCPWVVPDRGEAVALRPHDVAVLRGPDAYTFADDPATPVQVVVHPGPLRTTAAGRPLPEPDLGIRTWGSGETGSVVLVIGKYRAGGEISARLLRALPPLAVLPHDASRCAGLVPLIAEEVVRDEPGQQAVLDRLLDLLLVEALRTWLLRQRAHAPGWFRAHGDEVVGPALRLLHDEPARPWTVGSLAAATAVSPAGLTRRFTRLVGMPPMTYLTGVRLDLAADLMRDPDITLGAVARRVGYGTAFALSVAFKRVHGVSPQQFRTRSEPLHVGDGRARAGGSGRRPSG